MPLGSRVALMRWCRVRTSGVVAAGHHFILARPMPCSPVMTPFQARTWWNKSSRAAWQRDVFVQFRQAGVTEGIGEFTPQLPDCFTLGGALGTADELRLLRADHS